MSGAESLVQDAFLHKDLFHFQEYEKGSSFSAGSLTYVHRVLSAHGGY